MKDCGVLFFQLECAENELERVHSWLPAFIAKFDGQWAKIDVGCYVLQMQKDYPLLSAFQNRARDQHFQFSLVEFDGPIVGYFRRAAYETLQKAGVQVRNIAPAE